MTRKSTVWIALVAGFAVSMSFFALLWITPDHWNIFYLLQWPGFFILWLQPGSIESTTMTQYGFIGLPINGVIYASIIYVFLRLTRRSHWPLA